MNGTYHGSFTQSSTFPPAVILPWNSHGMCASLHGRGKVCRLRDETPHGQIQQPRLQVCFCQCRWICQGIQTVHLHRSSVRIAKMEGFFRTSNISNQQPAASTILNPCGFNCGPNVSWWLKSWYSCCLLLTNEVRWFTSDWFLAFGNNRFRLVLSNFWIITGHIHPTTHIQPSTFATNGW